MRVAEIYRSTLLKLRELEVRTQMAVRETASHSDFSPIDIAAFELPFTMQATDSEMTILNLLHTEGAIFIHSTKNHIDEPELDVEGKPYVPEQFDGYKVILGINYQENEPPILKRLKSLEDILAQQPEYLKSNEDSSAWVAASHNGFTYFGDGLITYKGNILHLQKQQVKIFGYLLEHYGVLIPAIDVVEAVDLSPEQYDGSERRDKASKIVSALNLEISKLIGYKPITTHKGRGWVLDFKDKE